MRVVWWIRTELVEMSDILIVVRTVVIRRKSRIGSEVVDLSDKEGDA
jgi:hypothetical protein